MMSRSRSRSRRMSGPVNSGGFCPLREGKAGDGFGKKATAVVVGGAAGGGGFAAREWEWEVVVVVVVGGEQGLR
jgi:hypothetical protein